MYNFYTSVSIAGSQIAFRGYEDGKRIKRKIKFQPSYFLDSKQETSHKNINGQFVNEKFSVDIKTYRNDVRDYKSYNTDVHGDISPTNQFISRSYPSDIQFDVNKIKVYNIDIEVNALKKEEEINGFPDPENCALPVTAVTIFNSFTKKYICLSLCHWDKKDILSSDGSTVFIKKEEVEYYYCKDEYALLNVFVKYWANDHPDVVTGWNINAFDIPYLVNRITKVLGEKKMKTLSPWNYVKGRSFRNKFNKEVTQYVLDGIAIYDYLELYQQYTYSNVESYKLDYIGFIEVGENKLSFEESSSLSQLFFDNPDKYVDYNLKDVALVRRIDDKMKLIDLAITVAFYAKINFVEVFSPIRTWDSLIYNHLLKQDVVIPPSIVHQKDGHIAGAYVKAPVPGKYKWVMSFDLASLYPSIIRSQNMGIDTYIEKTQETSELSRQVNIDSLLSESVDTALAKRLNYSMTANGEFFDNSYKSFLSDIMETLYIRRKEWKKVMLGYETREQTILEELRKRGINV